MSSRWVCRIDILILVKKRKENGVVHTAQDAPSSKRFTKYLKLSLNRELSIVRAEIWRREYEFQCVKLYVCIYSIFFITMFKGSQ